MKASEHFGKIALRVLGARGSALRSAAFRPAQEHPRIMAIERTLSIIKPDATAMPGATGEILRRFEEAGLAIVALKKIQLTEELARGFYAVHKARPFYGDLVKFMTSGPVVVSVLEGENAVRAHRDLLGPTNSNDAPAGHDPRRLRHRHRAQRRARLRRRGHREDRDLLLLRRGRDPRPGRGAVGPSSARAATFFVIGVTRKRFRAQAATRIARNDRAEWESRNDRGASACATTTSG